MAASDKIERNRRKELKAIGNLYKPIDNRFMTKLAALEYIIFRDFLELNPKTISRYLKELENFKDSKDYNMVLDERTNQREKLKRLVYPYKLVRYDWDDNHSDLEVEYIDYKENESKPKHITYRNCDFIKQVIKDLENKIKTTTNNKAISVYKRDIFLLSEVNYDERIAFYKERLGMTPLNENISMATEYGTVIVTSKGEFVDLSNDEELDEPSE